MTWPSSTITSTRTSPTTSMVGQHGEQQHTDKEHAGVVGEKDLVLVVTRRDRDPVRRVLREAIRLRSEAEDKDHDMILDPAGSVIKIKTLLINDKINE